MTTPALAPSRPTITHPGTQVPYYRTHVPALLPSAAPAAVRDRVLVGYEYGEPGANQVDFVLRTPANDRLARAYRRLATDATTGGYLFAGRGSTFYDDMGTTIAAALTTARTISQALSP